MTVLHTLRCMGFGSLGRVASVAGLAEDAVEDELLELARAGLVTYQGGWGITERGKVVDAERQAAELEAGGVRAAVADGLERFLVLNPELLDLCSAWQLRTPEPERDRKIVGLFVDLDGRARPVLDDLAAALPRFGRYRVRLGEALGKATAGDTRFLADDLESYHAVWFQWHEDLLSTLGIPR